MSNSPQLKEILKEIAALCQTMEKKADDKAFKVLTAALGLHYIKRKLR